jgi:hypothetical protein
MQGTPVAPVLIREREKGLETFSLKSYRSRRIGDHGKRK